MVVSVLWNEYKMKRKTVFVFIRKHNFIMLVLTDVRLKRNKLGIVII